MKIEKSVLLVGLMLLTIGITLSYQPQAGIFITSTIDSPENSTSETLYLNQPQQITYEFGSENILTKANVYHNNSLIQTIPFSQTSEYNITEYYLDEYDYCGLVRQTGNLNSLENSDSNFLHFRQNSKNAYFYGFTHFQNLPVFNQFNLSYGFFLEQEMNYEVYFYNFQNPGYDSFGEFVDKQGEQTNILEVSSCSDYISEDNLMAFVLRFEKSYGNPHIYLDYFSLQSQIQIISGFRTGCLEYLIPSFSELTQFNLTIEILDINGGFENNTKNIIYDPILPAYSIQIEQIEDKIVYTGLCSDNFQLQDFQILVKNETGDNIDYLYWNIETQSSLTFYKAKRYFNGTYTAFAILEDKCGNVVVGETEFTYFYEYQDSFPSYIQNTTIINETNIINNIFNNITLINQTNIENITNIEYITQIENITNIEYITQIENITNIEYNTTIENNTYIENHYYIDNSTYNDHNITENQYNFTYITYNTTNEYNNYTYNNYTYFDYYTTNQTFNTYNITNEYNNHTYYYENNTDFYEYNNHTYYYENNTDFYEYNNYTIIENNTIIENITYTENITIINNTYYEQTYITENIIENSTLGYILQYDRNVENNTNGLVKIQVDSNLYISLTNNASFSTIILPDSTYSHSFLITDDITFQAKIYNLSNDLQYIHNFTIYAKSRPVQRVLSDYNLAYTRESFGFARISLNITEIGDGLNLYFLSRNYTLYRGENLFQFILEPGIYKFGIEFDNMIEEYSIHILEQEFTEPQINYGIIFNASVNLSDLEINEIGICLDQADARIELNIQGKNYSFYREGGKIPYTEFVKETGIYSISYTIYSSYTEVYQTGSFQIEIKESIKENPFDFNPSKSTLIGTGTIIGIASLGIVGTYYYKKNQA